MSNRILDPRPVTTLSDYVQAGGGTGYDVAGDVEPEAVIEEISAAGLRGRGGAGFPTGQKWATTFERETEVTTVVVNAAEGEPGTFKDRALMRTNPYRILEGALIAARVMGATRIRLGLPASFRREVTRLNAAIEEMRVAGWTDGIDVAVLLGPESYLFGEETGMLEVMDGRQPFPRVVPPYLDPEGADLVSNAETMANVPGIIANGAEWFRTVGTEDSPGTIVVTVTGDVVNHGVVEVPMGTSVRRAIDHVGWRLVRGEEPLLVLNGASNAPLGPEALDTPLTYRDMAAAGSGLGSASLIVFDERRDPVAIAEGVARFLEVESCGQCEPCKRDGRAIADHLRTLMTWGEGEFPHDDLLRRVDTVATGARCNLARQQEAIIGWILNRFDREVRAHLDGSAPAAEPVLIAPIADIVEGRAVLESSQITKQRDWTHDERDSGAWPAARLEDTPVRIETLAPESNTEPDQHRDGTFSENPFEMVAHDHVVVTGLFEVVRNHPDDTSAVGRLGEAVREHCDMGARILAPMVSRHGRAEGDDVVYGSAEIDQHLAHEAARVAADGHVEPDLLDALEAEFRDHVDAEMRMLDVLRRTMDPDELRDLARAMVESELTG